MAKENTYGFDVNVNTSESQKNIESLIKSIDKLIEKINELNHVTNIANVNLANITKN